MLCKVCSCFLPCDSISGSVFTWDIVPKGKHVWHFSQIENHGFPSKRPTMDRSNINLLLQPTCVWTSSLVGYRGFLVGYSHEKNNLCHGFLETCNSQTGSLRDTVTQILVLSVPVLSTDWPRQQSLTPVSVVPGDWEYYWIPWI